MSLVGSRLSLIHRCTTERDDNADTDNGWNNPQTPDWQENLSDLPCRFWADAGREVIESTTTVVPIEDMRMIVPLDTDVTTSDRIASVTYRGDTIQAGPLGIRAILPRRDHLELVLVKVS